MREKGKMRKEQKILIRVNRDEKQIAEELSHKAGMNTSEYIRSLLQEAKEHEHLNLHLKIVEKYEKTLSEYRTLLNEARKNRG
jgi:antitoxin component of RelBE/YafQ-DinJ toxin-antitoxin module